MDNSTIIYDPAFGLFTVKCDNCNNVFAAENLKCVCECTTGKLQLDIDKMLNNIYNYILSDNDKALDIIVDVFWHLHNKYDIMNDIMDRIDVTKLNGTCIISFLMMTANFTNKLSNRKSFCERAIIHLKNIGDSDTLEDVYRYIK